jgi:predicted nucleic acid-binding protein
VAPDLALAEATNILRRLELAAELERSQAAGAARDLLQLDLALVPFAPFAERIWELRHNLTSYDAWYVAAAEALDLPVATLDRRLTSASGPRCQFLHPG